MRVYVPDMTEFFRWMDAVAHPYVVMRGFLDYNHKFPAHGSKEDIDLMVEDTALPHICERYKQYSRKQGSRCDVHNVSGRNPALSLVPDLQRQSKKNKFYPEKVYPERLACDLLASRRLWQDRFYIPSAEMHLAALLFHITYQKAEDSGIHIDNAERSAAAKYCRELDALTGELGIVLPYTLAAFHRYLQNAGYGLSYDLLTDYLCNAFSCHAKSFFYARICDELTAGEMNLFVIRRSAVTTRTAADILNELRRHYELLAVKDIPLWIRLTKSRHMRGNKWRRGGHPSIAVVVFDPAPVPVSEDDRKAQPFVLNVRQFMKRALREWFTKKTGRKPSCNPLHSTDNEAEAIRHLGLFFSAQEQQEIFQKLRQRRQDLATCAS